MPSTLLRPEWRSYWRPAPPPVPPSRQLFNLFFFLLFYFLIFYNEEFSSRQCQAYFALHDVQNFPIGIFFCSNSPKCIGVYRWGHGFRSAPLPPPRKKLRSFPGPNLGTKNENILPSIQAW